MLEMYPIQLHKPPYEANFNVNGSSYHLVFGKHTNGWFLCIPNHQIGIELAHPSDCFWNQESLMHAGISSFEAHSIARALKELSYLI